MATSADLLHGIVSAIELGDGDRARLVDLHAKLSPQFPAIATRFYARLLAIPQLAQLLGGPDRIRALESTLVAWMSSGLLGPYDTAFVDGRSRIGRSHVAIGLPQHYMFTAMNAIRGDYDDRIAELYDPADARLVSKAIDKLLDVELALILRHYAESRVSAQDRETQAERVTAIQTLSAGLAHEIRNPLNSAKLQLGVLERRLRHTDDPKLVVPIEIVNHEIERLTHLLNEFLAFARPTTLSLAEHDVVDVVRTVFEEERTLADASRATLELAGTSVVARVDAPKLHQILQSLVRNSLEAITPGGHVAVTVAKTEAAVSVCVVDDGPGIPDEIQKRMFEPFFSTKESGTGLGMSIVHSMVALHGGTIAVASSTTGTRIDVTLPR